MYDPSQSTAVLHRPVANTGGINALRTNTGGINALRTFVQNTPTASHIHSEQGYLGETPALPVNPDISEVSETSEAGMPKYLTANHTTN